MTEAEINDRSVERAHQIATVHATAFGKQPTVELVRECGRFWLGAEYTDEEIATVLATGKDGGHGPR